MQVTSGQKDWYANTQKQPLSQHLAFVGLVSKAIVEQLTKSESQKKQLGTLALLAGIFHDIGKIDPNFQNFLLNGKCSSGEEQDGVHISAGTKHSFSEYPRHNEISWALLSAYVNQAELCRIYLPGADTKLTKAIRYAVYWHHAKPLRDPDDQDKFASSEQILKFADDWLPEHISTIRVVLDEAFRLVGLPSLGSALRDCDEGVSEPVPGFKISFETVDRKSLKTAIFNEARFSLIRTAVVTADRYVSKLSPRELAEQLEYFSLTNKALVDTDWFTGFETSRARTLEQIDDMVARFESLFPASLRNQQQSEAAQSLADSQMSVLQGPAGCGKTKIMLQYLRCVQDGRQCFIFVPRTAIAEGLYRELTSEYGITHSVELVVGGSRLKTHLGNETAMEYDDEFGSDIVITTFDQLCSVALSHRRVDLLTRVLSSTVIFDEFHELFDISGLVLLFLELIKLRLDGTAKTLLVSATPIPYFYKKIIEDELDTSRGAPPKVVRIPSFNTQPIEFNSKAYSEEEGQDHPYFTVVPDLGDVFISNKASTAQRAAVMALINKTPAICFHSKFTPKDKARVLKNVMDSFGKSSGSRSEVLYSGPIVQASLNISTRHLHTEATHAENFLQRLGRANRFGNFGEAKVTVYFKTGKGTDCGVDISLLSKLAQKNRAVAWNRFLQEERVLEKTLTIVQLYELYDQFHRRAGTEEAYSKDFDKVLESSAKTFKNKSFDPLQIPSPKSPEKGKRKLSTNALRGESYYLNVRKTEVIGTSVYSRGWLWDDASEPDELLTDELLFLRYADDSVHGEMLNMLASKDVKVQLFFQKNKEFKGLPESLLKKSKRLKKLRFFKWLQMARDPATPMVASFPGGNKVLANVQREYLVFQDVPIGLVHPMYDLYKKGS